MEFMRLYSGIAERCFNACAQDFTSKVLTSNEVRTPCCLSCALRSANGDKLAAGKHGRASDLELATELVTDITDHLRYQLRDQVPQVFGACQQGVRRGQQR